MSELTLPGRTPAIETTLVIHLDVPVDFRRCNQLLDTADRLLVSVNLEGKFQIVSFRPDYRFADTRPDDPGNFTNRAPYPILHLLREESLERVIGNTADLRPRERPQSPLRITSCANVVVSSQPGIRCISKGVDRFVSCRQFY